MLSYNQSPSYFKTHLPTLSPVGSLRKPKLRLRHRHLFIITGPAGCGKTTVAEYLTECYGFPYLEGDDFHPDANVAKMRAGIPLADADRWDWLINLREEAVDALDNGANGVVLTCSALKKKYRDVIRVARYNDHDVRVHFIYLRASEELLLQRVKARKGHYMKSSMIKSQLQCLEEPEKKERDVHSIDVNGTPVEVQKLALDALAGVLLADLA